MRVNELDFKWELDDSTTDDLLFLFGGVAYLCEPFVRSVNLFVCCISVSESSLDGVVICECYPRQSVTISSFSSAVKASFCFAIIYG